MMLTRYQPASSFCLICNTEARIINYGALSCYSCKAFFRRHGHRIKNIRPCRYDDHCEITIKTRRLCSSCRMKKCLAMGMSVNLIRKDFQRKRSPAMVQSKHDELCTLTITPMNLLQQDQSSLNKFEWNLLSNVIHAFDRYSLVPSMTRMINSLDKNESNLEVQLSDTLNLFAAFYTCLQSFISSTADFRVLTIAEQSSLYERNLHGLFNLCGTFMLRDAGMFDNGRNERMIIPLHGREIIDQTKKINTRLDSDSTLVKMMHIIFAFSSNCFMINYDSDMHNDALLDGTFRLFGSQNVYIEILWKYMTYRYGSKQTALRFAALIKQMLDLINISARTYGDNPYHQILVDDLVDEAKIALVLHDENVQPLWGKTSAHHPHH